MTIDIPEPLYKRVKVLAVERGKTLKQSVLGSLERELKAVGQPVASSWANRKLRPEFNPKSSKEREWIHRLQ